MTRLNFELNKIENGNVSLAAATGKSDSTIRNYRENKSQPPLDVALKIAEFINVPVTDLFDEVDENGVKIESEKITQAA